MIILLVVTIFVQMTLNSGLSPLSEYLPLSMAQEMSANESKYARQMMEEEHQRRYEESFRSGGGGSVESPETLTGPRFAGASAPKQVESAPAHRLDTPSEYYDAPGMLARSCSHVYTTTYTKCDFSLTCFSLLRVHTTAVRRQ